MDLTLSAHTGVGMESSSMGIGRERSAVQVICSGRCSERRREEQSIQR